MTPEIWIAALFGLVLGSFLNVCVYRLPYDLSVLKPARSFCPRCLAQVAWYDNIPLLSWLLLGAKCRRCRQRISWQYPAVELLTALAFASAIWRLGPTMAGLKLCLYGFLLIGCIFTDLRERILPDEFTLGGTYLGLMLACLVQLPDPRMLSLFLPPQWPDLFRNFVEAAGSAAIPALLMYGVGELYLRIRGREGLGFGDVKMVAMMGAFYGLGSTLVAVMFGSILGSIIGLGAVMGRKEDAGTYELPFGTFLGVAALLQQHWPVYTR